MKNLALVLLFVAMSTAVDIEPNSENIEKKQEKRGISSLGYAYGSPGLGYDSGAFGGYAGLGGGYNGGYASPVSYNNRIHYTSGYNGGYGGYSGLNSYSGGIGSLGGYNSYNTGYNGLGGYSSGYSGIYNRGGLGYSVTLALELATLALEVVTRL